MKHVLQDQNYNGEIQAFVAARRKNLICFLGLECLAQRFNRPFDVNCKKLPFLTPSISGVC